jgi:PadR family transcriptional regulator PadR
MARRDKLQGSLDLLVLKTVQHEPLHGYGITSRIAAWSEGGLEVKEGSLYPALHRLERDDLLAAEWRKTDNGRRAKYYRLTRTGLKHLEAETERWGRLSTAIAMVLKRSEV